MGKRVSAKDMLSAGRARPPRESLAEQPVIPAAVQLMDQSPSHAVVLSTSEEDDQTAGRSLHLVTSSPDNDQGTSGLHDRSTKPLGDEASDSAARETTSEQDAQTTSSSEQAAGLTATKPPAEPAPPTGLAPDVELEDRTTSPVVATQESVMPEQASSAPVAQAPSALADQVASALMDESTVEPTVRTTSQVDAQLLADRRRQDSEQLVDLTTREPSNPPTHDQVADVSVPAAAIPNKRRVPRPAGTAHPAPAFAPAAVGEPTGTYQRVTVFLTPAQRTWLKTTGRQLPVDGLSVSDIVRLAVTRLSEAVSKGLPLLEELTTQAYSDAQTMTGRRNRGLPPL